MAKLDLFPRDQIVGIFRGFQQGGLEFHADLILPYQNNFQNMPMHGQFLLVQLETEGEAVLGRITSFSSDGKLSFGSGEEFNIRAMKENRDVPEDLREQYLKYRVNIRVLGVLRNSGNTLTFVASHRRLPHVGSHVGFPSPEVLREIAGHNLIGAHIGHLALGEYIYLGKDGPKLHDWMQIRDPETKIHFPVEQLVSRRSFIFARAGFGKSNLNKLLFSKLYAKTPTVEKRAGKKVPVGTVIFDPDGEYFWPDDKGRPGLCDVPELEDKVVVFTSRKHSAPYYQSFVAGGIKLDIRRLRPSDVIAIALPVEKQDQQNVGKLKALSSDRWQRLVDLISENKNLASLEEISEILSLDPERQQAEAVAARSNMTLIVNMLHDKSSQLMDLLISALQEGKLCIVDISQMRGAQSLVLTGLILRRIFDRNQEQFISAEPKTIPVIAVVEEAQSVLVEGSTSSEPYVSWVKEGRKYDLGALLITQQPGSIPVEILSQGDNWFIFHLLSANDLQSLKRANAHFSDDLLSSLLNEPIQGQGVFWSSVGGKPYPIPLRVLSFEDSYRPVDNAISSKPGKTFAEEIKRSGFPTSGAATFMQHGQTPSVSTPQTEDRFELEPQGLSEESGIDLLQQAETSAINALSKNEDLMARLRTDKGVAWGELKGFFKEQLPKHWEDLDERAFKLVPRALSELLGPQDKGWTTHKVGPKRTTFIKAIV
jgi:hypothetical protein